MDYPQTERYIEVLINYLQNNTTIFNGRFQFFNNSYSRK